MQKKTTIFLEKEDIKKIEDFQNLMKSIVCDRIDDLSCGEECPFYDYCTMDDIVEIIEEVGKNISVDWEGRSAQ